MGDIPTVAGALELLARVAVAQNDLPRATRLMRESLALYRSGSNLLGVDQVLMDLARAAPVQGDEQQSLALYAECLTLNGEVGDRVGRVVPGGTGGVRGRTGWPRRAARLFGCAEALRESIGAPIPPVMRGEYERDVAGAAAQVDDVTWAMDWEAGRTMTMEQAIAYASEQRVDAPAEVEGRNSYMPT
jgi:hypothetical protein